jgi:hypothetical protein
MYGEREFWNIKSQNSNRPKVDEIRIILKNIFDKLSFQNFCNRLGKISDVIEIGVS